METNRVALEQGWNPFWSDSILFQWQLCCPLDHHSQNQEIFCYPQEQSQPHSRIMVVLPLSSPLELPTWNMSAGCLFFFFKIFGRTRVLFVGPLIPPVLDFWWCLPRVSKLGWISHLHALSTACNEFLSFTSGATPDDLLVASMAAYSCLFSHLTWEGVSHTATLLIERPFSDKPLWCSLLLLVVCGANPSYG